MSGICRAAAAGWRRFGRPALVAVAMGLSGVGAEGAAAREAVGFERAAQDVAGWASGQVAAQATTLEGAPQTALDSKAALRARQAELFAELRQKPDDLGLMFRYAEVSARAEDYEAAISTFERMLIYDPNLPRVRLELGALYFKIGSYAVAKRYFESVLATSEPPEAVRTRIGVYLREIDGRSARHRFAGSLGLGLVFSTNANLGPSGDQVLFAGLDATLDERFVEREDFGLRASARLTHAFDLGTASDDSWRTEVSAFGLRYENTADGEVAAVTLRTGPSLSADARQFGLKVRPFAEVGYLDVGRDPLYWTYGAGVEAGQTIADQWYAFGEARVMYRDYFTPRQENDGFVYRGVAGVAFAPTRDLSFRLVGQVEREDAREPEERSWEGGARVIASFDYAPGIESVDRKWNLSGFARVARRHFDAADVAVDPRYRREDTDYALGVAHTFHIRGGWAVVWDADYLYRDSNLVNFDLDSFNTAVTITYNF